MKTPTNVKEQLFASICVIADRRRKKLLLTKETVKNLNKLNCCSTTMYFAYKHKYPDYEDVIVTDFNKIPYLRLQELIACTERNDKTYKNDYKNKNNKNENKNYI